MEFFCGDLPCVLFDCMCMQGKFRLQPPAPPYSGMVWYGMVWYGMVWYAGECTCPDGNTYMVSDKGDHCGSLHCNGGAITKACSQIPMTDTSAHGMGVTCAAAVPAGVDSNLEFKEYQTIPTAGVSSACAVIKSPQCDKLARVI